MASALPALIFYFIIATSTMALISEFEEERRSHSTHFHENENSDRRPADYTLKPEPKDWILGFDPHEKRGLLYWLLDGCWGRYREANRATCIAVDKKPPEYPGFDGWYNNIAHPELGAVDTPLLRHVPTSYEDGVYKPSGSKRPNPLDLSEALMKGDTSSMSATGRTAFIVFFGQQVVEEILDAQRPACPPEYFNISIPRKHPYRSIAPKHSEMPFLRTRYDMRTGYSPNNPRQQLNEITPYIDGGLIYGTSKAWSDQLRRQRDGSTWKMAPDGLLASTPDGLFPAYNVENQLPLANPPPPFYHDHFIENHETFPVSRFFKLGNPRGNENAFLLAFGVLWFRWHNAIAAHFRRVMPAWDSERIFSESRKWVIATQQHITVNDWLPQWLGEKLPEYEGYDPHVDPQIEQPFQSAAMRFGHTLVPKGVYLRDYARNGCSINLKGWKSSFVRTCNIYWRPQEPILSNYTTSEFMDIDRLLMGMALQLAEREDNKIVEDLRGRVFGPLEFSRRDLMALNIQRARDHGLPDYNTIRRHYGLKEVTSFDFFRTPEKTIDMKIIEDLIKLHNRSLDDIDLWVGGLLETANGPGELFRTIIKHQFKRIRDGDRFWYANLNNGLFSKEEVERIENLTIYDIVMTVTKMDIGDIQLNPFMAPENISELNNSCHTNVTRRPCINIKTKAEWGCYSLPPIQDSKIEECTQPKTYDYFWGSETAFAVTYTGIGIIILGLISLLLLMINWKEQLESKKHLKIAGRVRESFSDLEANTPFSVEEWIGKKEAGRRVVLMLDSDKKQIQILSQKGGLLRFMDVSHTPHLEVFVINGSPHVLLRVRHEYDLVVKFDSEFQRENFLQLLDIFISETHIAEQRVYIRLKSALHLAVTKADRQKRLEMFFRVVFSQAFNIDSSEEEILNLDSNEAREVIYTELTVSEFADALSMKAESEFVSKMFTLVDKDKNGFISFREFLDILIIFAKGSADEKAKLMFDMYDIKGTGLLTKEDFINMIKSLMDTVNAELEEEQIQNVIYSMMLSAGLSDKEALDIEDFQKLLVDYKDNIGYAGLSFAGLPSQSQIPMQQQARRMSSIEMAHLTIKSMYKDKDDIDSAIKGPSAVDNTNEKSDRLLRVTTVDKTMQSCLPLKRFVEIHARIIFWTVLFTLVLLGIFAERCYYYSVEREHSGLRKITGYGVSVTRGAASAMMFSYSTILLTMCRNTITHLRETFLIEYIPFDSFIFLHKYIALWSFFFTAIHVLGHSFNFYHISTQTSDDLTCLFRNYFHASHEIPKFKYWCWETITGITGVFLTVLIAIMGIFSVPLAREKLYSAFWLAHSLHPLLYILIILHGIGRFVQEPIFHYFFMSPCILFTLDRIVTFRRKKVEIPVIKAELLPSNVTMLEFKRPSNFEYRSGQWVRIACPAISESEFHPFTLSSAPHEGNLTVHIRAIGPWTVHLRQMYDPNILRTQHLPKIYLDGPYGAGHQDWYQFEVSVLIGGGIGVTPFASILKDIVFRSNVKLQTVCKKVYFLWITRTQKQFEWFVDIIKDLEAIDKSNTVSVHIFVTQFYHKFDLRTILLYICERHFQRVCSRSLFTGLMAVTHFGRPDFAEFFASLQELHSKTGTVGVFSCGSPLLTTAVDKACLLINKNTVSGPILRHHTKNF